VFIYIKALKPECLFLFYNSLVALYFLAYSLDNLIYNNKLLIYNIKIIVKRRRLKCNVVVSIKKEYYKWS